MNEDKKEDEIYCPECGEVIKRNAAICTFCGNQLKELITKSKTVAKYKNKLVRQYKTVRILLFIIGSFFYYSRKIVGNIINFKSNYEKISISPAFLSILSHTKPYHLLFIYYKKLD